MPNPTTCLALLLLSLAALSCNDFLDETPRDEISLNQFFTEPAHAQNAVNALYRDGAPAMYMNGGVYSGRQIMYEAYLSGFFDNEYKGQEPFIQFAQQLSVNAINSDGFLNGLWSQMYRAIGRANNAIKYIPTTPGLSQAENDRLLGEARFFRAWAYFTLVRYFGDVPLIVEPYESLNDIYRSRDPVADVYTQIVADLDFAVNDAGLATTNMVDNGYRVTRAAAATLLADVQLTRSGFPVQNDSYAAAATAARRVINGGSHSLAEHSYTAGGELDLDNSAYNKLRRQEALTTEFIYPIEFTIGISNSGYPEYSYPVPLTRGTTSDGEIQFVINNGAYQPRDEFIRGYDPDEDLRIQNRQFFHFQLTDAQGQEVDFQYTPYIWHDDVAVFESAISELEVKAYGYAEVLLIAAEAIARSEGVTAEAVDYLTQVRSRAYYRQSADEISGALSGLSVDAFVEEVWKERFRELVFDFKLWFDMVRTRTYPETSAGGEIDFVPLIGHKNTWGQTFEAKHLLLPLPQQELQRNAELVQNDGY
ncbi:SusD-like protein P2 [Neolewinella maritima]|uniref:SusD-like protein P2 n=1 Tax=Neolewinella maritima TaxID=1383882 RepID=A0ABM9B1J7_9BACT|nr:RagB/SusD family nutrient uptake outer membrane protein [Neolewinella maritima]CAH1000715.1 SusD-like protein P2 [Neolewinella maritima]